MCIGQIDSPNRQNMSCHLSNASSSLIHHSLRQIRHHSAHHPCRKSTCRQSTLSPRHSRRHRCMFLSTTAVGQVHGSQVHRHQCRSRDSSSHHRCSGLLRKGAYTTLMLPGFGLPNTGYRNTSRSLVRQACKQEGPLSSPNQKSIQNSFDIWSHTYRHSQCRSPFHPAHRSCKCLQPTLTAT